jgi:hypothetical protein
VLFVTDVANDYFFRTDAMKRGHYTLEMIEPPTGELIPFHRMGLFNGRATLRFRLPESIGVGEKIVLRIRVMDAINQFMPDDLIVDILPPAEPETGGESSRAKPPGEDNGDSSHRTDQLSPPPIIPVRKPEWSDPKWDEPWTEFCALRAMVSGKETGGYDIYLNMDNIFLKQEMKRLSKKLPEELDLQWESAMTLIAVAILSKDERIGIRLEKSDGDGLRPEMLLRHVSRVLAPVIIPLMNDV